MYQIRKGQPADIPAAYELVRELAIFEKAEHELVNTPEQMLEDAFGPRPVFDFMVVEDPNGEVVATAIYYYNYSTWKGKCLYLDDIVVKSAHRRKGIGRLLFDALVVEAKAQKAARLQWQVLDWNTPAIAFYQTLKATFDPEWINCKLEKEAYETYQSAPKRP